MNWRIAVILAAITIIALLYHFSNLQPIKPEIVSVSHEWGEVNEKTTEVLTHVKVRNQNPFPLPVKDVRLEIFMNGVKVGESSGLKTEVEPDKVSEVVISTKIDNFEIKRWWVSHIKNGERSTIKIKGYLVFDLGVSEFRYPVEFTNTVETDVLSGLSSKVPEKLEAGPITLEVKSVRSYWGDVTENFTEVMTLVTVYNTFILPIPVPKMHYVLEMNRIKLAEGDSDVVAVLEPRANTTLTFVTTLDNRMIDEWWVSHIKRGERTEVKLILQPVIEVLGKRFSFTIAEMKSEFRTNLLE